MRKNALLLLVLCAGLVLSGCGKKTDDSPAGQEAAENTFPEEVVLNESTEESGSIKNENTDEETGEAADEISTECRLEADHDGLIAELGADAEGYTWHYIISDENLMKPESEYMEEREDGKILQYVFRAKQPGEASIFFFYVRSPEEMEIPEGEDPADYSDVTCSVHISDDLTVELDEY